MSVKCHCRKGDPAEWELLYKRPVSRHGTDLRYTVCTPCLNVRLDLADSFPEFEPDEMRRIRR